MADNNNPFGTPDNEEDNMFSIDLEAPEFDTSIPEDTYVGKCIDVVKGTSKAGNPMWTWTFTIIEGPYSGEDLKLFTAITPAAIWKLVETLNAFGIVEKGKPVNFARNDVLNTMVYMDVVADEYNGQPIASLDKVRPYDQIGKKHIAGVGPTPL